MKALKIIGITLFLIFGIAMCMNTCDDEPRFTDIQIGKIPEGVVIENVTAEIVDPMWDKLEVRGEFVNNRKKRIEIQQITVDLYDKNDSLIASPITSTGTKGYVEPGERVYWRANWITKLPAKAVVSAKGIYE